MAEEGTRESETRMRRSETAGVVAEGREGAMMGGRKGEEPVGLEEDGGDNRKTRTRVLGRNHYAFF